jgi:hypothetical protein
VTGSRFVRQGQPARHSSSLFSARRRGRRHRARCSLMLPSMTLDEGFAPEDRAEVCSLSRGVMLQPLSVPLQRGIRFFRLLIPARPTTFLAVSLPRRAAIRAYHVPAPSHDWVRARLFAGGTSGDVLLGRTAISGHIPFWVMPNSSFGMSIVTTFISDSHLLPMSASLVSWPRRCLEPPRNTSRSSTLSDFVVRADNDEASMHCAQTAEPHASCRTLPAIVSGRLCPEIRGAAPVMRFSFKMRPCLFMTAVIISIMMGIMYPVKR